MQRNEKLECIDSAFSILVVFLTAQSSGCEQRYFDLGNRLEPLHTQLDNSNFRAGLIDEYRDIEI
jgi:hypothetical protein